MGEGGDTLTRPLSQVPTHNSFNTRHRLSHPTPRSTKNGATLGSQTFRIARASLPPSLSLSLSPLSLSLSLSNADEIPPYSTICPSASFFPPLTITRTASLHLHSMMKRGQFPQKRIGLNNKTLELH